jgi:hypothetical protein
VQLDKSAGATETNVTLQNNDLFAIKLLNEKSIHHVGFYKQSETTDLRRIDNDPGKAPKHVPIVAWRFVSVLKQIKLGTVILVGTIDQRTVTAPIIFRTRVLNESLQPQELESHIWLRSTQIHSRLFPQSARGTLPA